MIIENASDFFVDGILKDALKSIFNYHELTVTQSKRYAQAKKVTLIGAAANACLGLLKIVGGAYFHSHALIADGVHSFSDLLTDAMVLVASKYGSQDADTLHPYGHQRIETATTLLLAMLLILTGAGIAWDSLHEVLSHQLTTPQGAALPIAICAIITNELLFHYTHYIGKQIDSALIIANAWHHRSDAAASLVVTLGLIGSMAGFHVLDPIAAIIIGSMIIKMGIRYGWDSVKELVDTGVSIPQIAEIEKTIHEVPGVERIHQLRSRMMGKDIFIDVHVIVSPYISVSEGHYIAQFVHHTLTKQMKQVKDVTVHIDPEDDEVVSPSLHLPSRRILEQSVLTPLKEDFSQVKTWVLHYLDGKIHIDILLTQAASEALQNRLTNDFKQHSEVTEWRFFTVSEYIKNKPDS